MYNSYPVGGIIRRGLLFKKECHSDGSGCYIPATEATIYCSYDEMLATGNGCWEGTSWHDHPCPYSTGGSSSDVLYTPCDVDYFVSAIADSNGKVICGGADGANNSTHLSGPVSLAAGEYELYPSFVGAVGWASGSSPTNVNGVYVGSKNYNLWVPDVMLIMDKYSTSNFKCYNIMHYAATNNTCSIPSSLNIGAEVSNGKLIDFVDSSAYANAGSMTVECPYFDKMDTSSARYTFEAGKVYYIHVGSSASNNGMGCTSRGCGYIENSR